MITVDGDRLKVSGGLTMDTVPAMYAEGLTYLTKSNVVLDLSGVDDIDSSAVSLLLGWMRVAQQSKHEIKVISLPDSLTTLAGLYGVAEMLPVQVQ